MTSTNAQNLGNAYNMYMYNYKLRSADVYNGHELNAFSQL